MRVLFVHQNIEGAGAESAESREIIKSLLRCGCCVGVLYVGNVNFELPGIEEQNFLRVERTKRINRQRIQELISRFQPEVAHVKSLWTPFHAKAASVLRGLNVPYIVEPGGHMNPYLLSNRFGGKKMWYYQKLGRLLYRQLVDLPLCRKAAGIRALSNWEAGTMRRLLRNEIRTIPLGFNREWITGERLEAAGFPGEDQPIRVNYLGRLDITQKGLDLVLESLLLIKNRGLEQHFQVRLSGPDVSGSTGRLQKMIADRALKNVVVEGGCFGEAKNEFFRNTDIFLHVSRMEEMAKLAREAIGSGIPVLASLESNFGDWVRLEGSGLVTELNAISLAEQLIKLSENPSLIREMASSTSAHAGKYSWDTIARQLMDYYEAVRVTKNLGTVSG